MDDIKAKRKKLLAAAQAFVDEATSYLLDVVPDGTNWEDAQLDVDAARTVTMDMIDAIECAQVIEEHK